MHLIFGVEFQRRLELRLGLHGVLRPKEYEAELMVRDVKPGVHLDGLAVVLDG